MDNQTPQGTDDYSLDATQMRSEVDPGEFGTEVLPTSLAGELERLRWALREAKGTTRWYETPGTALQKAKTDDLTNRTGVALAAGDVLVPDTANDSSVVLGDVVSTKKPLLVSVDAPANLAVGRFARGAGLSPVVVNVTGAVTRGRYLRKSATTRVAEDAGVLIGDATNPPAGAFAVALTAAAGPGAGTVQAWLLGQTEPGAVAPAAFLLTPESAIFPATGFPQLVKNAGTNWTDYTLDYDAVLDESAFWFVAIPTGLLFTGAEIEVYYRQAAAITGAVMWSISTLTRAENEAWDTAGANAAVADTVPGTAGQVGKVTNTLSVTGWAAGEVLLANIARAATAAPDTLTEDCKFIKAVLRLT